VSGSFVSFIFDLDLIILRSLFRQKHGESVDTKTNHPTDRTVTHDNQQSINDIMIELKNEFRNELNEFKMTLHQDATTIAGMMETIGQMEKEIKNNQLDKIAINNVIQEQVQVAVQSEVQTHLGQINNTFNQKITEAFAIMETKQEMKLSALMIEQQSFQNECREAHNNTTRQFEQLMSMFSNQQTAVPIDTATQQENQVPRTTNTRTTRNSTNSQSTNQVPQFDSAAIRSCLNKLQYTLNE
jgi:hypothetical protein